MTHNKDFLPPKNLCSQHHLLKTTASSICFLFFKFIYFIYSFLAGLGLGCCVRAFSSCGEQGLLFIAVHGLLIEVASLVAEHWL